MGSTKRVTLELRNSKASELGPQTAEQIFASLPQGKSSFLPFSAPKPISFEFHCVDQTVILQTNLPEDLAHYHKSQIAAAYPEVLINISPKEVANFHYIRTHLFSIGTLELNHGSFYPLKTHKDYSETDPISATLGFFSKLGPKQAAMVQILVASSSDSWKTKGYTLAAGSTDAEGKTTPHPFKTQIEEKLSQVSHRVAIKIATAGTSQPEADALIKSLADTFMSIQSAQGNVLKLKTPLSIFKNRLLNSLSERNFVGTKKQYLSLEELATIFHLPYQAVKDIKNIAWGKNLLGEPPEQLPTHAHTSPQERDNINLFAKTEFKNEEQVFGIKDDDRRRHIYVIGKSGTGKSTLLANMIINDLKHNKGLAVIDPHGDLAETILDYIPSNRINDVVYLNPADTEYTVRMNLLENIHTQHKELIASGIIAIFKKLYGYSWGPRLEHILRNTVLTLTEKDQSTMEDIVKILTNKKFRDRVVDGLQDQVLINFWNTEFSTMDNRQRSEAVAPILNKIGQFVSSPLIRNVINHPTSSFSLKEIMDDGKILIANLSQGKLGEDNAALLGAMLITKIQLTAMNRVYTPENQRRDFYLYVDEFQNFATTSFVKILSEARKYRLNLALANQYVDQVDEEVRKAIFGNAATLVTFLVGASDAALLSAEFGQQYTPDDLVSIGRYQIVLKLSVEGTTSVPFPAKTLELASSANQNRQKVITVSRERYAKKKLAPPTRQPHQPSRPISNQPKNRNNPTNPAHVQAKPHSSPKIFVPKPIASKANASLPEGTHPKNLNPGKTQTSLPEGQRPPKLDKGHQNQQPKTPPQP